MLELWSSGRAIPELRIEECKKKRTEEEHLHVYVAKALGPSEAKTYVGKLYRA